ncbi:MAG: RidA family protein [Gemmatimonadota bacterium]
MNPESLGEPRGWSHGMLAPAGGRVLFVAGQTARGPDGGIVSGGFVAQFELALERVLRVVSEAGGVPGDIGRMTVYVTDLAAYRGSLEPLGEAWRRQMGRHYPAMALVEVRGLVDEGALVEIEATAVLSSRAAPEADGDGQR